MKKRNDSKITMAALMMMAAMAMTSYQRTGGKSGDRYE